MQRTQILLEEWQYDALRSLSEQKGRSVSSLIREWIAQHLEDVGRQGDIDDIAGIARSRSNPKQHHDQVLYRRRKR